MNSFLINFEINDIAPSVNIIYKRSNFGGLYCNPKVLNFKDKVYYILKHLNFDRTDKNVKLDITFYVTKTNCDLDNLLKITIDSMNKIVFNDDRQVIEIVCKKVYGKFKRTTVNVYTIE
jgi:Holliday junction resolvase RusA-like endonuclease